MSGWYYILQECVKDCNTPTLLIFENIETVGYPKKIKDMKLTEEQIYNLKEMAFKTSRLANLGRVDLKGRSNKYPDLSIEGAYPFQSNSDPRVAKTDVYSKLYKYSSGGSDYGVQSHEIKDNWHCQICGTINNEDTYKCYYCFKINKEMKEIIDLRRYYKTSKEDYYNASFPSTYTSSLKYSAPETKYSKTKRYTDYAALAKRW